jgi:uncharacterized protein Usg
MTDAKGGFSGQPDRKLPKAALGGPPVRECAPAMEDGMALRHTAKDKTTGGAVSSDFLKQLKGYGLTTAEILYRRPDHRWLLQSYVWQDYDLFPNFPALKDFLAFWQAKLEGPLFSVTVAHSKLIKPAELKAVDGEFRLH